MGDSAGGARGTDDITYITRSIDGVAVTVRCISGIICGIEDVCCFGGSIRGAIDVDVSLFIIIVIIVIITEAIGKYLKEIK